MEDLVMDWPLAISSLEPLRPLSPEVFDQDDIADLGIISVGRKLSRSELAGRLQDHLDERNNEETEPEPIDWYATEKSIDLPLFDNVPFPQYYQPQKYQNPVQKFHSYAFEATNDVTNDTYMQPAYQKQHYDGISTTLEASPTPPPPPPVTLTAAAVAFSPPHHVMYSSSPATTVAPGQMSPPVAQLSMPQPTPMMSPVSPVPSIGAEWVKAETLTPPESPKDDDLMKLLQEFETKEVEVDELAMARRLLQEIKPDELEQLVRTRVDDITSTFSEKSFSMDELSDSGGVLSPFVGSEDSGLDDPEWSPPRRMKSVSGYSSAASSDAGSGRRKTTHKRKTKPYSRPAPEDRKQRKKEQNKNAATRYRMKKKAEVEEVRHEEKKLEDRNKELKAQLDDINREVKYLKSLMRDVYRKKGLIK